MILNSKAANISDFIEGKKTIDECIERDSVMAVRVHPLESPYPLTVIHWDLETILKKVCQLLDIPLE